MSDSDKYSADSGRRRFIRGVVGGAALTGVGTTGAAAVNSAMSSTGSGGGPTQAYAIENTGGPAPRGMPQIPIEIDDEDYIRGAWPEVRTVTQGGVEVELAITEDYQGIGVTYSQDWFQYYGVQTYDGLNPTFESDNYFRFDNEAYDWQSETYSAGGRLNINDSDEYETWGNGIGQADLGMPTTGMWRLQDTEDTMPIQVLRSTHIEETAQDNEWLAASTDQGVIAWLNKCTRFCCVPGYKQAASFATFGGGDGIYCRCHQSVYDPFSIVETLSTALPCPGE